jgi:choline dehydrogenase-like flavoprotein
MAFNDFYADGGNVQMRGKILHQNLERNGTFLMRKFSHFIAERSFDFWVMSEDLPDKHNRVELREDGSIRLSRKLNNLKTHKQFVSQVKKILHKAGLQIILERPPSPSAIQHQVGTLRMGDNPKTSVVAPDGRTHQLENLYVADASIFPSSAAVNPSLTIAANALRVADSILKTYSKS